MLSRYNRLPGRRALWICLATCATLLAGLPPAVRGAEGLNTPRTVHPALRQAVDQETIDAGVYAVHLFSVLLGRRPNGGEFQHRVELIREHGRAESFDHLAQLGLLPLSPEERKSTYVGRLFRNLLNREPSAADVSQWSESLDDDCCGAGSSWQKLYNRFLTGPDLGFRTRNSCDAYYDYGEPVQGLTLADYFRKTARFAMPGEVVQIGHRLPGAPALLGGKMSLFRAWDGLASPARNKYYSFVRGVRTDPYWNLFLMESDDGVKFRPASPAPATDWSAMPEALECISQGGAKCPSFPVDTVGHAFDAHVAVDHTTCPPTYVMTYECVTPWGGTSSCASRSQTPNVLGTWSPPQVIVEGFMQNRLYGDYPEVPKRSASTPVPLIVMTGRVVERFVAWAEVQEGLSPEPEDTERTTSSAYRLPEGNAFTAYTFRLDRPPRDPDFVELLSATPGLCRDIPKHPWDCNMRNIADWKREGDNYVLLYQGDENYFPTKFRSGAAFGIAPTAAGALGTYTIRDDPTLRPGPQSGIEWLSYPTFQAVNGQLYMYYHVRYSNASQAQQMRSKLVPR